MDQDKETASREEAQEETGEARRRFLGRIARLSLYVAPVVSTVSLAEGNPAAPSTTHPPPQARRT